MSSYGGDSSIGSVPDSSVGGGSGDSNADENITHTRGVIDDLLRNLTAIRDQITEDNWEKVAGQLDDADEIVEQVRELLVVTE